MNSKLQAAYDEIIQVTGNLGITFKLKEEGDRFLLYADGVTLKNHKSDIRLEFSVNDGGGAKFRAVFDRLKPSKGNLSRINDFNEDSLFFHAYIRTDKKNRYFTLRHFTIWDEPSEVYSFVNETMSRFTKLSDNKLLKKITRRTK